MLSVTWHRKPCSHVIGVAGDNNTDTIGLPIIVFTMRIFTNDDFPRDEAVEGKQIERR